MMSDSTHELSVRKGNRTDPAEMDENAVVSRILRLKCSDGSLIRGSVNLNRFEEGFERASDVVTKNREPFIVMYNVTVDSSDYEKPVRYKSLLVNRSFIIWAVPDEDR